LPKVTRSSGFRPFTASGKLSATAKQALSQRILDEIKQSPSVKEDMLKLAMAKRLEVSNLAKGYFTATLQGAQSLVQNSQVPVNYAPIVRTKDPRGRTQDVATRIDVGMPIYLPGKPSSLTAVSFAVSWKGLTVRYARRRPMSKMFYAKRGTAGEYAHLSAQLAFIAEVDKMVKKASKSTYYKKPISTLQPGDGSFKFSYTINYPKLPATFDFIRLAFIHNAQGTNVVKKIENKIGRAAGIAYAEDLRPLIRPYAAHMGVQFKQALKSMK